MTIFPFSTTIPAAGNNPSNDQPIMLANNQSNASIWNVDHVGFGSAGSAGTSGGQHLQVSFNGKNVPIAPTDPLSVLYTNSGTASTVSQMFFRNQNGNISVSSACAFGIFQGRSTNGAATQINGNNVASVTRTVIGSSKAYQVVLTAGIVTSTTFGVLVTSSFTDVPGTHFSIFGSYTITGAGNFNLFFVDVDGNSVDPAQFTFQVLQL
jgi:hypothetical protein